MSIEEPSAGKRIQPSFTTDDQPLVELTIEATMSAPTTTTTTAAKGKENPYAKPSVDKCYKCGGPGHRSNECPKRR